MSLFEIEIPLDASEAVEAVETLSAASGRDAFLPHHLRQEVQRRTSPVAAEDEAEALGVTAGTSRGVVVIGCGPSLRALVGSLRSQGVK